MSFRLNGSWKSNWFFFVCLAAVHIWQFAQTIFKLLRDFSSFFFLILSCRCEQQFFFLCVSQNSWKLQLYVKKKILLVLNEFMRLVDGERERERKESFTYCYSMFSKTFPLKIHSTQENFFLLQLVFGLFAIVIIRMRQILT